MTEKKEEMQVDEPKLADEPDAEPTAEGGGKEPRKVQTVTHVEMTGLTLLSPRQRPSNNSGGVPAAPTLALPLPALRPEEPAASLRAALSDIVGFAHVTRYRLAVEGIDGGTRDGFVSNDVPANGKSTNGSQHPPGGKNGQSRRGRRKKSNGGQSSKDDHLGVVSPYTGRGAAIEPALSRDAEGPDHVLTGRDADGNKLADKGTNGAAKTDGNEGKEKDGTDLLSLDEYSDLASLEALLRSDPSTAVVTRDLSAHEDQPAVRQLQDTIDGSSYGIRVVLERYDVASVREHVHRVRTLLRGGAPHLRAVLSEEEVAEAKAAARKGFEKEGGEEKKEAEETNGASRPAPAEPQAAAPPKSEDEAKKEKEAEEAKKREDEARRRSEISAQLPAIPADYDLSHSEVRDGDLRAYYHLVCGEEGLSAPKPKNGAGSGTGSGSSVNPTPREIEDVLAEIGTALDVDAALTLSEYNPPPSHRRAAGDLAYVKAVMPDGLCVHVTATPLGFYVSRSTGERYDPRPVVGKGDNSCCFSHSLLDCLLLRSKSLRTAWAAAIQASQRRADYLTSLPPDSNDIFAALHRQITSPHLSSFGNDAMNGLLLPTVGVRNQIEAMRAYPRIDHLVTRPGWLVPAPPGDHRASLDSLHGGSGPRNELDLQDGHGLDPKMGQRDWNEDLQQAREMRRDSFMERMDRARMMHKVQTEYGDACLNGVRAIIDGHLHPMNPNESPRNQIYLYNNIFFSRAVDTGLDTLKMIKGDAAARKSASRDASNLGVLHRLDVKGLHILGTVLVEYLGMRFVCQTIAPGIMQGEVAGGEQGHKLLYGSIESFNPLASDEGMHELMDSALGGACMVATRTLPKYPLTDERMEYIDENRVVPVMPAGIELKENDATEEQRKETVVSCGPIEMKGILGSDKRKYVLDCTRLTGRDANWVSAERGGTGKLDGAKDESSKPEVPNVDLEDDEWAVALLRSELVRSYSETKLSRFVKEKVDEVRAKHGDEESMDEAARKLVSEAEAATLRYNVNVFLPDMRPLAGVDADAARQLAEDEETAREMALYLWDEVLPRLTREVRASCGIPGFDVPVEGRELTELIHGRGINCRYLGRLADLAKDEERRDAKVREVIEGVSVSSTAGGTSASLPDSFPRFRMPPCWLDLIECEIAARAAKHVLSSYFEEAGGALGAVNPARIVANFLSALVSTAEEGAADTERRLGDQENSGDDGDLVDMLADLWGNANGDNDPSSSRSHADVWSDIANEAGRRYCYTLSFYGPNEEGKPHERAMYGPLLRRVCQRSGIRLVANKYVFGEKCLVGSASGAPSYPIAQSDILDILPLVKNAASLGPETFVPASSTNNTGSSSLHLLLPDTNQVFDLARSKLHAKEYDHAIICANEAANLFQRVTDTPLHPKIISCMKILAVAHAQRHEVDVAAEYAAKYLTFTVQYHGFDSSEAVDAHTTLSDILQSGQGRYERGSKHCRASQFINEFLGGRNNSGLGLGYFQLGTQYIQLGRLEDALACLKVSSDRWHGDFMIDCLVDRQTAHVYSELKQCKEAFELEKNAHKVYSMYLGENHETTKSCKNSLLMFMKLAVQQGKEKLNGDKHRIKESRAAAIADQITADEDAAELSRENGAGTTDNSTKTQKRKKRQSKKKKK